MRETIGEASSRTTHTVATLWKAQGECWTTWHFQLVGRPDAPPAVASLHGNDGFVVHMHQVQSGLNFKNIVDTRYYSDLPTGLFRVGTTDISAQESLLSCIRCRLTPSQAVTFEGLNGDSTISVACLYKALKACANGRAPGRDGIPYEFYKFLWDELSPLLADALSPTRMWSEIHNSDVVGPEWADCIILFFRRGKGLPFDLLPSYRPITLLNCYMKLAACVVSDRMHCPLN
jgi:hypothetical protein